MGRGGGGGAAFSLYALEALNALNASRSKKCISGQAVGSGIIKKSPEDVVLKGWLKKWWSGKWAQKLLKHKVGIPG